VFSFCGPGRDAFYAYAYISSHYNTALYTYKKSMYMRPHCNPLHLLCSWSGYGPEC